MATTKISDKDVINSLKDDILVNSFLNLLGFDDEDIDKIFEQVEKELEKENKPKRVLPSSKVDINKQKTYHKLVQEYIDTEIKPWNSNRDEVNDEYAKYFEFACWISNR